VLNEKGLKMNEQVIFNKLVLLSSPPLFEILGNYLKKAVPTLEYYTVSSLPALEALYQKEVMAFNVLLSFGVGIIVPKEALEQFKLAINIHAASPDYPGRDPHHFATYEKASTYGATAHYMIEQVDAGGIIKVEQFSVNEGWNSQDLLNKANQKGIEIFEWLVDILFIKRQCPFPSNIKWRDKKTTRKMFLNGCGIEPNILDSDFQRKYRAFQEGINHKNLYIDIHGHRFRYEGPVPEQILNL
jgi:methionyl-tRNA formyltransferase